MKSTARLIAVGLAGISLAACGSSGTSANAKSTISTAKTAGAKGSASTTSTVVSAAIGFNSARTEFVLPHNLGLLPAPELALAKIDAAYAAGLANATAWVQTNMPVAGSAPSPGGTPKMVPTWFYIGSPITNSSASSQQTLAGLTNSKATTIGWNAMVSGLDGPGSTKVVNSTSVPVQGSTLNPLITAQSQFVSGAVPSGDQLVAASPLEIQAAPIGTLAITGSNIPAFCVPTPEAWIANGKPVSVTGLPTMTAGPAAAFAAPTNIQSTQSSQPPASSVVLYDQGVASCSSFK